MKTIVFALIMLVIASGTAAIDLDRLLSKSRNEPTLPVYLQIEGHDYTILFVPKALPFHLPECAKCMAQRLSDKAPQSNSP